MPIRRILVVDDSPTERFFSVDLLTKAGYQVTTAENGEEGIAKAKASKRHYGHNRRHGQTPARGQALIFLRGHHDIGPQL